MTFVHEEFSADLSADLSAPFASCDSFPSDASALEYPAIALSEPASATGTPPAIIGAVLCEDGKKRPPWAATDPLLRTYYDTEWGMPVVDERGMLEMLCLEGFLVGLSWRLVLSKRDALRDAFHDFEPGCVAAMTESDIDALMEDPSLIRNRRKLAAAITNARAALALREEGMDLAAFIWSYQPETTLTPQTMLDIPTQSTESEQLAADLKDRGFTMVGPVTMYSLMAATGIIDAHLMESWRRGTSGVWR